MPVATPREEREKQIQKLCEGTVYSFAGWDGEYVNSKSRIFIRCEKHGLQSISLSNFLSGRSRCKSCRYEKASKSNVRTESETLLLLSEKGFHFLRWKESYANQYSKAIFYCDKHGEYEKDVLHALLRDAKCQKCSGLYRWTQREREQQVIDKNKNYNFRGWVDGYENNTSRIKMMCDVGHEWNVQLNSYIHKPIGCPRCGGTGKYKEDELLEKVVESLKEGTNFLRWVDKWGGHAKAVFECDLHGKWITTASSIVHQQSGCPSCALTGYQPSKSGTLYCLRSECGQFVKIGITNDIEQRLRRLKKVTPFDFHIIELFTHGDGRKAYQWEKIFHQTFESANFKGFEGATEWLKWTPDIQGWFRFLN